MQNFEIKSQKKIAAIKHSQSKFLDIIFHTAITECQNDAFVRVMEIIKNSVRKLS